MFGNFSLPFGKKETPKKDLSPLARLESNLLDTLEATNRADALTPKTWSNFGFQNYRNRHDSPDSDGSLTPTQERIRSHSQTPGITPVRNSNSMLSQENTDNESPSESRVARRNTKMRFSFICQPNTDPAKPSKSTVTKRPSLATSDDGLVSGEYLESAAAPNAQALSPAVKAKQATVRPTSPEAAITDKNLSELIKKATPYRTGYSSNLRNSENSEYFDAVEKLDQLVHLGAIEEDEDAPGIEELDTNENTRAKEKDNLSVDEELARLKSDVTVEPRAETDNNSDSDSSSSWSSKDNEQREDEEDSPFRVRSDRESFPAHLDPSLSRHHRHHKPCTTATKADAIRMHNLYNSLRIFRESDEIFSMLMNRFIRMIEMEDNVAYREDREAVGADIIAKKLRDFLEDIEEGRKDTGESPRFVDHQLDIADWIVEATETGVLHVKTEGCGCEMEW